MIVKLTVSNTPPYHCEANETVENFIADEYTSYLLLDEHYISRLNDADDIVERKVGVMISALKSLESEPNTAVGTICFRTKQNKTTFFIEKLDGSEKPSYLTLFNHWFEKQSDPFANLEGIQKYLSSRVSLSKRIDSFSIGKTSIITFLLAILFFVTIKSVIDYRENSLYYYAQRAHLSQLSRFILNSGYEYRGIKRVIDQDPSKNISFKMSLEEFEFSQDETVLTYLNSLVYLNNKIDDVEEGLRKIYCPALQFYNKGEGEALKDEFNRFDNSQPHWYLGDYREHSDKSYFVVSYIDSLKLVYQKTSANNLFAFNRRANILKKLSSWRNSIFEDEFCNNKDESDSNQS